MRPTEAVDTAVVLLAVGASTMLAAAALVPLARRLATRFLIVDQPGHRKVHARPTPRLGGLAIFLLKDQDNGQWTKEKIAKVVETKDQTRINLKAPIQVHITYLTAWAEQDGTVHFRKDGYKRDATLRVAMNKVAYAGAR